MTLVSDVMSPGVVACAEDTPMPAIANARDPSVGCRRRKRARTFGIDLYLGSRGGDGRQNLGAAAGDRVSRLRRPRPGMQP